MDELSEARLTLKRDFGDFLDGDHGYGQYPEKIKAVVAKENVEANRLRLLVDLQDLQNFSQRLHRSLLTSPGECLGPFEEALGEIVRNAYPKALKEHQVVRIGVCGELGDHRCALMVPALCMLCKFFKCRLCMRLCWLFNVEICCILLCRLQLPASQSV